MDSHALNFFGSGLKAYILEAAKTRHVQQEFSDQDLIQFVFDTMTTFSEGDGTIIKSIHFSEFGSQTNTITHGFYLV